MEYQQIKPTQPEKLDIDSIIAQYHNKKTDGREKSKETKKEKPKLQPQIGKKEQNKEQNEEQITHKMIFSSYSIQMSNTFKEILQKRFAGFITQLQNQRKTNMQKLFKYLCYGLQEILECHKDPLSMKKLQNILSEDFVMLLDQRVSNIDMEILNTHNIGKSNQPTLKLKNQWKLILEMVKEKGNSKLREAIITDQVQPSFLVYAKQMDLIKYLSQERQKKLKNQVEGILKHAESEKDRIHLEDQADSVVTSTKQTDNFAELDSFATTQDNESSKKQGQKKCQGTKRSKPNTKRNKGLDGTNSSKKLRKLNESS